MKDTAEPLLPRIESLEMRISKLQAHNTTRADQNKHELQ